MDRPPRSGDPSSSERPATGGDDPGRLSSEPGLHLQQHARDPVAWYPWGPEAFAAARDRQLPIFLSIGYASCHWCRVMQRESFQDPSIAHLLNTRFVPIKVDRETRPDVDALYIAALLRIQGQAGWPASLFLGPDLRPFTGATYLPPTPRYGLPAFREILERVDTLWRTDRDALLGAADAVRKALLPAPARQVPDRDASRTSLVQLVGLHDALHGGFGEDQRFPQPNENLLLLEAAATGHEPARRAVRRNLDAMAGGALRDPIGGGFHRYCVDRGWTRPRFEKLLPDNAQLLLLYARASAVFGSAGDAGVAEQTARFLEQALAHPAGGFTAGLSAEQAGVEGAVYAWSPEQVREVLGPVDPLPLGLDRSTIPRAEAGLPAPEQLTALARARSRRPQPERDDKRVVAYNGLAIGALAEAGRLLARPDLIARARQTAELLLSTHPASERLPRLIGGRSPGFLDDHASVARGLILLYQALPHEPRWLLAALQVARVAVDTFRAPDGAFVQSTAAELPVRLRPLVDEAEPSGNGLMAHILHDLAGYGALDAGLLDALFEAAGPTMAELPAATPTLHRVHRAHTLTPPWLLVLAGAPGRPELGEMLQVWNRTWRPHGRVMLWHPELAEWGALQGKAPTADGTPRAWLCRAGTCLPPMHTAQELDAALT